MPNVDRNAKKEHAEERLTGSAPYFNIDEVAEPGSKLPHTMPDSKTFTTFMRKLGIVSNRPVVCYD